MSEHKPEAVNGDGSAPTASREKATDLKREEARKKPEARPNRIYAVGFSVVWFLVFMGQFLLFGKFAHRMGDPVEIPRALRGFNSLFNSGPESVLEIFFLVVWMALIVGAAILIFYLIFTVTTAIQTLLGMGNADVRRDVVAASLMHGFISIIPMMILAGLLLAILPLESTKPEFDNNLAVAKNYTWDEFQMWVLCSGTIAMISIVMLFVGVFGMAAVFAHFAPDGSGCQLFIAIFIGIFLAMLTAFGLGDWVMKPLYAQYGGAVTLWAVMSSYTFLTSGLIQWKYKG